MLLSKQTVYILIAIVLQLWTTACQSPAAKKKSPPAYNLANPDKFLMPESLLEISGITFNKGNNDTIYAIQDEEGKLFRLAWDVKKQYNAKFGKKGDYEDVAITNDRAFILKSNGTLFSFSLSDAVYEDVDDVREWKQALPEGEYEGMYGDNNTGNLYVICKNCPQDNKENKVTGYIIQSRDSLQKTGEFTINVAALKSLSGKVKNGFRPSALAKNPVTGEWFILASANKLLVITDKDWNIKDAYPLSGNTFNQPEGITFDKAGNLYISNEGDDLSDGNILKFPRQTGN